MIISVRTPVSATAESRVRQVDEPEHSRDKILFQASSEDAAPRGSVVEAGNPPLNQFAPSPRQEEDKDFVVAEQIDQVLPGNHAERNRSEQHKEEIVNIDMDVWT